MSPAYASCATEAVAPPYAFIGTVISTEREDRVATVITDSGRQVKVLGTQDANWFATSFSSVDRRYALAGRSEFHPINAESPYQDDRCTATHQDDRCTATHQDDRFTATHQLAGPRLRPLESTKEFLPGWLPVDEQAGLVGYLVFFGPEAAAMALLVFAGREVSRRFTTHRSRNSD
jgi:hypothetical protein